MRDIFTVAKFTIQDMINRKSFRISTIIILVLIILGFNAPKIISSFTGDSSANRILIVDQENLYNGQLACTENESCDFDFSNDIGIDEIKSKLNNDELDLGIIISTSTDSLSVPVINFIAKDQLSINDDQLAEWTIFLQNLYHNVKLHELNLKAEELQQISPTFLVNVEYSGDAEISGNIPVMLVLSCVLFFAIYFCAFQVSSSITTEKTSKIMETLVTSTSPRNIVIGKTLGIGLVGLGQVLLFGATAIVCAKLCLESEVLEAFFDLSNFTPYLVIITLIYFLLGYFVYAFLYAVTGSTVSKPEDIQSANTPVVLLTMISFYLAYFTLVDPTSNLNVFAALFPFSSAFCMPLRIMMGLASGREVALSIGILVVSCIIIAHIAIKIYSNAILNYGNKLSFKDILKLYKEKT